MHTVENTYLSGVRKTVYDYPSDISLYINKFWLTDNVNNYLKQCVNQSFVFTAKKSNTLKKDLLLFFFVEFEPGNERYLLDGYVKSLEDIKHNSMKKFFNTMFNTNETAVNIKLDVTEETVNIKLDVTVDKIHICKVAYHPDYFKLFVFMDLDKTAYLSKADVIKKEDLKYFIDEYEVSGKMAISDEFFTYKMMIRPGMYWAIRRLQRISELSLLTAGDLHFARNAVIIANLRKWVSTKDITTDNEQNLQDTSIQPTNLFSCRDRLKYAAPKNFERCLPFANFINEYGLTLNDLPVLGIDDSLPAWDVVVRPHVIPISVFQPLNNSHTDILKIVEIIEKTTELYFNTLIAELFKDSDPSITELHIDVERLVKALKKVKIIDILTMVKSI